MEQLKLSDIKVGESCVAEVILSDSDIRHRFMDLGIIKGTKIKCLLMSSYNSIKAYSVRGKVIAIRKSDAEKILVRRCASDE
ncbi:MAG: ferrous iron transport protein A [Ruminococcaceae bacterium]|nr:ferrous iron transport protein A [Oscillospiraceae bacterium]